MHDEDEDWEDTADDEEEDEVEERDMEVEVVSIAWVKFRALKGVGDKIWRLFAWRLAWQFSLSLIPFDYVLGWRFYALN